MVLLVLTLPWLTEEETPSALLRSTANPSSCWRPFGSLWLCGELLPISDLPLSGASPQLNSGSVIVLQGSLRGVLSLTPWGMLPAALLVVKSCSLNGREPSVTLGLSGEALPQTLSVWLPVKWEVEGETWLPFCWSLREPFRLFPFCILDLESSWAAWLLFKLLLTPSVIVSLYGMLISPVPWLSGRDLLVGSCLSASTTGSLV